ncbi:MAG: hypothetical protein EXQ58_10955 [Acidobacteria bacterium]|nr:hypothetical protein [Acidobacteriota bacterium]
MLFRNHTARVNRSGLVVFPDTAIPPNDQIPQFTRPRPGQEGTPVLRTKAVKLEGIEQVKDQFQPHVRNFVDWIKSRQQPVSDVESGHRTTTTCPMWKRRTKRMEAASTVKNVQSPGSGRMPLPLSSNFVIRTSIL